MNPDNNVVSRHGYDFVKSIDTPERHTVVVHLKTKFAPFVELVLCDERSAVLPVAPEHVLSRISRISINIPFNNAPTVATDRSSSCSGRAATTSRSLATTASSWASRGSIAVVIKIVPDENTSVNLLKTHAIDYMFQASPNTYPALADAIPDVKLDYVNVNGYEARPAQSIAPAPHATRTSARRSPTPSTRTQLVATLTHGTEARRDGRHSRLDVGVQSDDTFLSARSRNARERAARGRLGAGARRHHAQRTGIRSRCSWSRTTRTRRARSESLQIQAMLREAGIDAEIKYYTGDDLFAPAGMGGISAVREVRSLDGRMVFRHRSRRQLAVHVQELSAGRL